MRTSGIQAEVEFWSGRERSERQCEIVEGVWRVMAKRESSALGLSCREKVGVIVNVGSERRVAHQGMERKCGKSCSSIA